MLTIVYAFNRGFVSFKSIEFGMNVIYEADEVYIWKLYFSFWKKLVSGTPYMI